MAGDHLPITDARADGIARAHQALLAQHDLQFDFAPALAPPKPPHWLAALLEWLARTIGHGMKALSPAFPIIFWGGLAIIAIMVLVFIAREIVGPRGWGLRKKGVGPANLDADMRPSAAKARTLLADADRLAAEGQFGEAVHLLLFRSIEDIDARWPHLLRPALTSRDIAAHAGLPPTARDTFAGLARVVERSFFGGAKVGAEDFAHCRDAYAAFALADRA